MTPNQQLPLELEETDALLSFARELGVTREELRSACTMDGSWPGAKPLLDDVFRNPN